MGKRHYFFQSGMGFDTGFRRVTVTPCHKGAVDTKLKVADSTCQIYAGGAQRDLDIPRWTEQNPMGVILNLTGRSNNWITTYGIPKRMLSFIISGFPEVVIDWYDGKASPLGLSWESLRLLLKNYDKVLVHCAGGHGRTGTALAHLISAEPDPRIVETIRKQYCSKAVESPAQMQEIESIYGTQTDREVKPMYTSKGWGYGILKKGGDDLSSNPTGIVKGDTENSRAKGLWYDNDGKCWYLDGKQLA